MVSRRGRSRVAHVLAVGFWGSGSCSRWVAWCVCAAGSPGGGVGSGRVVGLSTGLLGLWCGVRCLRGVVPGHQVRLLVSTSRERHSLASPPEKSACPVVQLAPAPHRARGPGSVSRRWYRPDAHDREEGYIASGEQHKWFTP